jgi:membrane-bound ClpP family serine protease
LDAIPGTWLLLYGCSLIAASVPTTRTLGAMGTSFMIFGLITLVIPHTMQILMLGAGFSGLHILFGFLISRRSYGRET